MEDCGKADVAHRIIQVSQKPGRPIHAELSPLYTPQGFMILEVSGLLLCTDRSSPNTDILKITDPLLGQGILCRHGERDFWLQAHAHTLEAQLPKTLQNHIASNHWNLRFLE